MNAIEQGSIKRFKTQEGSKKKIKSITRCNPSWNWVISTFRGQKPCTNIL